jgi:hypothetical protein
MSTETANLLTRDNLKDFTEQQMLQIPLGTVADVVPFSRLPAGAYTMQFAKSAIGEITRGE